MRDLAAVQKLWDDQQGATLTLELILMVTIVGLGTVVGLAAFRDAVSQEFGDASAGLAAMDQGYRFDATASSASIDNMRFRFEVSGSAYVDQANFCEPATLDPVADSPMCMEFTATMIQDES